MEHKETKTETKEVTTSIREWVTCDRCQETIHEGRFDVVEGVVSLQEGERYPDGGHITTTKADICPKCFHNWLVPLLRSQGLEFRVEELNY